MEAELALAHKTAAAALGEMALALAARRYRSGQLELWVTALRRSATIIETLAAGLTPPSRVE